MLSYICSLEGKRKIIAAPGQRFIKMACPIREDKIYYPTIIHEDLPLSGSLCFWPFVNLVRLSFISPLLAFPYLLPGFPRYDHVANELMQDNSRADYFPILQVLP